MFRRETDLLNGKLLTEVQRSRGQEGKLFKLATLGINSFCLRKQTDNSLTSCLPADFCTAFMPDSDKIEPAERSSKGETFGAWKKSKTDIRSSNKVAFTLAEVLITLAVIGVVAAVTMPVLMTNINERVNSERQANIVYKITQAMEHMRATGKLTAYDSTESFVNELQKHLKIQKVCDKDHIADCWTTDKVTNSDGEEKNVADTKTSSNLGLFRRANVTNNVGLILADGASIILNYDNTFEGLDIGNKVTASSVGLPVGNHKSKVFEYTTSVTAPVSFVMDVNGKKGPNSETIDGKYHDIRSFNGAGFGKVPTECYNGTCIYYVGTSYTAINCNDPNGELYSYCSPTPSGRTDDYWAGANAKCASMNMTLPTVAQLQSIYADKFNYPSIASNSGKFWSSEEYSGSPQDGAIYVYFNNGNAGYYGKGTHISVLCLGE